MDNQVSSVWFDNKLLGKLIRKLLTDKKWKLITELFLVLAQRKWIRWDGTVGCFTEERLKLTRSPFGPLGPGRPLPPGHPWKARWISVNQFSSSSKGDYDQMIKKLSLSVNSIPHLTDKISPWANSCWCEAQTWLAALILHRTNKKVLPSPCKVLKVYVAQKN